MYIIFLQQVSTYFRTRSKPRICVLKILVHISITTLDLYSNGNFSDIIASGPRATFFDVSRWRNRGDT